MTERKMDMNIPTPDPGSGMQGLSFLKKGDDSNNSVSNLLFGNQEEHSSSTPLLSNTLKQGTSESSGPSQPSRTPKPELVPALREDFSAEALERQRSEQYEMRQREKQRRAAYDSTLVTYNDLVPLPPPPSVLTKIQPYVVYITLAVALILLALFFFRKSTNNATAQ